MQPENIPTSTVLVQPVGKGGMRTAAWWKKPVLGILPFALLTVSSAPQADANEAEPQQDEQSVSELKPISGDDLCPRVTVYSPQLGGTFQAISIEPLSPELEEHPPYPEVGPCLIIEFSKEMKLYKLHKRDCAEVIPRLMRKNSEEGRGVEAYTEENEGKARYVLETLNLFHRCGQFKGYPVVRLQEASPRP